MLAFAVHILILKEGRGKDKEQVKEVARTSIDTIGGLGEPQDEPELLVLVSTVSYRLPLAV